METLISKIQALEIAHSLLTYRKGLDDYGFTAKKEAASIINDMMELDRVEQELMTFKEPESKTVKKDEPLTIADL